MNGIFFQKVFWNSEKEKYSCDLEKLLIFYAEGREFAKIWTPEQFIQTVKGQNNAFLPCSWRFLRYNTLEQFKLENIIGTQKPTGKGRKVIQ